MYTNYGRSGKLIVFPCVFYCLYLITKIYGGIAQVGIAVFIYITRTGGTDKLPPGSIIIFVDIIVLYTIKPGLVSIPFQIVVTSIS